MHIIIWYVGTFYFSVKLFFCLKVDKLLYYFIICYFSCILGCVIYIATCFYLFIYFLIISIIYSYTHYMDVV